MLMGQTDTLPELGSSKDLLLTANVSEYDEDEGLDTPEQILYVASFEKLAKGNVKYDTIIWVSISLLLVLAWGVGIIMLLYLPFRRFVLKKDILSRKLYVTPTEIVYKVVRPSYIPFLGVTTIERHVPLSLVIDIIIEQGCLQSICGVHTFRIESKAYGKAAPVDTLLLQGVSNPGTLRKIIVTQATKVIQDTGLSWKKTTQINEEETVARTGSFSEGPAILASPSKSIKMTDSPRIGSVERRGIPADLLLQRIEEVNKSVKKIELLIEKSQASPRRAESRSIPPFPSLDF